MSRSQFTDSCNMFSRSLLTLSLLAALPVFASSSKTSTRSEKAETTFQTSTEYEPAQSTKWRGSSCSTYQSSVTSAPVSASTSSAVINPSTVLTATASGLGLNDYAKAAGKLYFGTAADIPGTAEIIDTYYLAELNERKDWGQITPANAMKVP